MTKQTWRAGTMLSPLPPALISSGDLDHPNVMTAAWTGIICSDPVITYVSLRPTRYTHELVTKHKEFVINLPTWKEAEAVDTVGVKSGRDIDKFALTGLTPEPSTKVSAPQVKECPVSIECKVMEVRSFGTHDMFLAEVVAVNVDDKYIDNTGALDLEKAGLLAYAHGFYYTLGRKIGKFGFSVEKKKQTPPVRTILKADEKFSKEKRANKTTPTTFMENGVEVIVAKPKFKKTKTEKSARFEEKKSDNTPKPRPSKKFADKRKKATSYEESSFKKRPNGSFKNKKK